MPWTCRLVERERFWQWDYAPEPGDLVYRCPIEQWPAVVSEWRAGGARRDDPRLAGLSDQYLASTIDRRPPLWLVLPSQTHHGVILFPIDGRAKDSTRGWEVSGEPSQLTLSPSINCEGYYHGWLQNGALSDDCEGRTFPAGRSQ